MYGPGNSSITSNSGYYNSDITALPTDADTIDVPIVDFIEPWDFISCSISGVP